MGRRARVKAKWVGVKHSKRLLVARSCCYDARHRRPRDGSQRGLVLCEAGYESCGYGSTWKLTEGSERGQSEWLGQKSKDVKRWERVKERRVGRRRRRKRKEERTGREIKYWSGGGGGADG